jgi:hypothetical protein
VVTPRQQGHLFAGLRQAPTDISAHGTRAKNRDTHSPSAQQRYPQERGVRLRAAQASLTRHPRTRGRVPNRTRAPCRAATPAIPPASLCLTRRRVKSRGVAWYTTGWGHTNGDEPGERGGPPRRMGGKTCQRWKANADTRGIAVADLGRCAACQQGGGGGAPGARGHSGTADARAASRATAGPLPG